jgi:hypothetical protein
MATCAATLSNTRLKNVRDSCAVSLVASPRMPRIVSRRAAFQIEIHHAIRARQSERAVVGKLRHGDQIYAFGALI